MSEPAHDPPPIIRRALSAEGRRLVRCQNQFDHYELRLEEERRGTETARAKSMELEQRRKKVMALLKSLLAAAKETQTTLSGDTGDTGLMVRWRLLRAAFSRRPAAAISKRLASALAPLRASLKTIGSENLKTLGGDIAPPDRDLVGVSPPYSIEREDDTPQLLIDVSEVCQNDAGTGIQRVVRAIFWQYLRQPPAGYRVVLVRRTLAGDWRIARAYTRAVLGETVRLEPDPIVAVGPGDIFLGIDFTCGIAHPRLRAGLEAFRARGAWLVSVVYDLLPANHPEWFEDHVIPAYRGWLDTVIGTMDAAVAISAAVAGDLAAWIPERAPGSRLRIGHFHLGADLEESLPDEPATPSPDLLPEPSADAPNFLMVGTIEPRKGHRQVLDACEILWQRGSPARLIIVGRYGWKLDDLLERLLTHPERGRRLFWLEDAGDLQLLAAYRHASALLAASYGEGFGLPLIEGARHGLPILARDIPVFREIVGEGAAYFKADTPEALAAALESWTAKKDAVAPSFSWQTWEQSARQLWSEIERLRSNRV